MCTFVVIMATFCLSPMQAQRRIKAAINPIVSDIDALITVIDATADFAMRECPRCHGFEVGDNADGTMHCDTCNVPVTPVKV